MCLLYLTAIGTSDYQDISGLLFRFDSDIQRHSANIIIIDDNISEPTESFQVTLRFSGIPPLHVALHPARARIEIIDSSKY